MVGIQNKSYQVYSVEAQNEPTVVHLTSVKRISTKETLNKPEIPTLRTSKLYDLDKLKNEPTNMDKIKSGYSKLAIKTKRLKTLSFYKEFLFKKIPIIPAILAYNLKSYFLPDIISGTTGKLYFLKIIFS